MSAILTHPSMSKIKFEIIGFAKHGQSKKGKNYIQLHLNEEQFDKVYKQDKLEKIFLFENADEFVVMAPCKNPDTPEEKTAIDDSQTTLL